MSKHKNRPMLQQREFSKAARSVEDILRNHHTTLLFSRYESGSVAETSKTVVSYLDTLGVKYQSIQIIADTELEGAFQLYSGWQYFPQLYVGMEFIGGSVVVGEFFRSGEYGRVVNSGSSADLHRILDAAQLHHPPEPPSVWRMAVSSDDRRLAVARADGTIEVLDVKDGREHIRLQSHTGWVNCARFSADGSRIFSGGTDTAVRLWSKPALNLTKVQTHHTRWVNDLAVDPGGRYIASVGADRRVCLWSPSELTQIKSREGFDSALWCAVSLGECVALGDEYGYVHILRTPDLETIKCFQAHNNGVTNIVRGQGPGAFYTSGLDGTVCCWSDTGDKLSRYSGHEERVWALDTLEGQIVASGSVDGLIHIWDSANNQVLKVIRCVSKPLALAYVKSKGTLVAGLSSGELLWQDIGDYDPS